MVGRAARASSRPAGRRRRGRTDRSRRSGRPLIGAEVDPDAVDLDVPARVAPNRPAPTCSDRRDAAAPGGDLDARGRAAAARGRRPGSADHPEVLRDPPAGLLDVVDRGVLEEAGDGIETNTPAGVHVREAHPAVRGVSPRAVRPLEPRVHRPSLPRMGRGGQVTARSRGEGACLHPGCVGAARFRN